MGNCNDNFQNIREDGDPFVPTQNKHINQQHQSVKPDLPFPLERPKQHLVDQQAIHSTILRRADPPVKVSQSEQPVHFPQISSLPSEPDHRPPKSNRAKLQQLDLTFYHSLALPDYEYQPIPPEEQQHFKGVQTYEMKDNYGVKYVGEWLNNNIHGNGVLLSNTSKYIGQFKFGLKHFHGREILKSQVYEGNFDGGRRKGLGIRYTPTSTERGQFDDELVSGEVLYLDGRVQKKEKIEPKMKLMQELEKENKLKNQKHIDGSLYTQNYYEGSQLPPQWYQPSELQKTANKRQLA